MLSACFAFHTLHLRGSVSDRPLTASAAPGAAPGHHQDVRDGLWHPASVGINTCNRHLPNFKLEASFYALTSRPKWQKRRFLTPSAHRSGAFLLFCPQTQQNLALGLDYLSLLLHPGSVNSGLIEALWWMSEWPRTYHGLKQPSRALQQNSAEHYLPCSHLPFISSIPTLSRSYLSGRTNTELILLVTDKVRENSTAGTV